MLRPELAIEGSFVGRFEREARIAARLDHPNIIPIYAVEEVAGLHYFVMKYIAGKSLDELLMGSGAMPVEHCRQILWQVACGLGHAHQRGVIHRDVKPSNIMIDESGRAVITDFGISKAMAQDTQYTSTGQLIGTPRYVSPEQAQGSSVDGRSDQYSLAVVGYQMLTGRLPLIADSVHALMYKHIYEVPTSAQSVRAEIPTGVSDALQRALAKNPDDRFPTMEEFATALWPERPVSVGQPTPTIASFPSLARLIRRQPRPAPVPWRRRRGGRRAYDRVLRRPPRRTGLRGSAVISRSRRLSRPQVICRRRHPRQLPGRPRPRLLIRTPAPSASSRRRPQPSRRRAPGRGLPSGGSPGRSSRRGPPPAPLLQQW